MPITEVDELELQQNRAIRSLVEGMAKNPRTARKFAALVKEHNPDAKITEPPADPYDERINALQTQLAEEKKAREDESAKRQQETTLTAIRARQDSGFSELRRAGWTEDGIKGVEKMMEEHGILDPMIAASHFEKLHPPQAPVAPSGSGAWNFTDGIADTDTDLKRLIETKGESSPLVDKMAREALAEVRGTRR